jgi:hypothetical protein
MNSTELRRDELGPHRIRLPIGTIDVGLPETFKEYRNNLRNEGSGQYRLQIRPFTRANKWT